MKKGWKVFWIVCAVMAAAGIVMTAAGIALGGAAMLSSADESGPVHEWLQRTGRIVTENTAPGEPDGDMITAYEGIDEISMDLSGLGVIAEPTDGDDVIIDTSQLRADIREALVITQDGGKLEMETDSHRGFGRNASDPGMLYISLPQGAYYNSFSADVGAGFLEMRGISAGEISLDVGAGQIIAEGFYADVLEADCGAGQITLQGEVVENADLNCDIGEVLFTLPGDMGKCSLPCRAGWRFIIMNYPVQRVSLS